MHSPGSACFQQAGAGILPGASCRRGRGTRHCVHVRGSLKWRVVPLRETYSRSITTHRVAVLPLHPGVAIPLWRLELPEYPQCFQRRSSRSPSWVWAWKVPILRMIRKGTDGNRRFFEHVFHGEAHCGKASGEISDFSRFSIVQPRQSSIPNKKTINAREF